MRGTQAKPLGCSGGCRYFRRGHRRRRAELGEGTVWPGRGESAHRLVHMGEADGHQVAQPEAVVGYERRIGSYRHQFSSTQSRYGPLQHAGIKAVELAPKTPDGWQPGIQRNGVFQGDSEPGSVIGQHIQDTRQPAAAARQPVGCRCLQRNLDRPAQSEVPM